MSSKQAAPADNSDSGAAAAFFNAVWANLLRLTYDDELPPDAQASGGSQWTDAAGESFGRDQDTSTVSYRFIIPVDHGQLTTDH